MANESDLQLASKFFTERELDGELYADTASLEIQGEPVGVVGKYAVIAVMKRFHNSFPDFAYTVKATELTENKSVHVTLSASGTFTGNPFSPLPGIYEQVVSTGQPVSFDDGATVEIVDGKVNKVVFEAGGGLVRAYLLAGGKAREQPPSRHLLTVFEYLQHLERSKSDHISEALKVFVEGHESTPALQGRDLLFGLLYRIRASFPDFTYVVSDILEQDDAVSVDVLAMGQFKGDPFSPAPGMMPMLAPTGNVVSRKDRVVFRFEGDTVVSLTTLPTGGAVGLYDAASGLELGH